ncbi:hypothetical protein LCGC14_2266720 [marine sediment metagenome]|uniref:Uncharacterized protein n=1 Tax=marine sediment metagenome TaxID=412755 RepID=A0A0F9FAI2_9ZZZZ
MAIGVGDGTTLTYGTTAFAANIIDIGGPGATRTTLDSTHLGTAAGFKTKILSNFVDGGTMSMTVQHDANLTVPIDQPFETITIDWGALGDTWSFSGAMTGYNPRAEVDGIMTADVELVVSGAITGM